VRRHQPCRPAGRYLQAVERRRRGDPHRDALDVHATAEDWHPPRATGARSRGRQPRQPGEGTAVQRPVARSPSSTRTTADRSSAA
jgi:hypothetical protein